VPTWSISRNYKENWNSTKISVTPGMHLTRGGNVQSLLTSGPRGWPAGQTPWPDGSPYQPLTGWLHGHALQEAIIKKPKLEVRPGGRPAMWLGRPAITWCVTDLIKSVTPPWTPINTPLPVEFNTPHSTCSSPLVKFLV
jgi:hypothetical protein